MKKGLVVSDSGPIFSLALIDKLEILNVLFDSVHIPRAVWEELTRNKSTDYYQKISSFFENKVKSISSFNELTFVMDYGESEAVILYKEIEADYLLIDDKKARKIAENFDIQCIGTIGILSIAKDKKLISELKPLFEKFIRNKRHYGLKLLNAILDLHGEKQIQQEA